MSKKIKITSIILAVVLFLSFLTVYINFQLQSPINPAAKNVLFEINPNTPSIHIAENLKSQGLIRSKWLFLIYLKLKKGTIQAGTYELSASLSMVSIVSKLISGGVKEWLVTFPEGFSLKDIAERLAQKGIVKKEDFLSEASLVFKYEKDFPFLSEIKISNLEGYLFPDTYRFDLKVTPEEIVEKELSNFDKKIDSKIKEEIKNQGKTLYEVITLASIVEREAKKLEDRPLIASVFLNRLSQKMKLEADPTVQYAKGSWETITAKDYKIDSPYNTYKYPGLPPGPICNPGLDSIKAVLYPEKTDYFYFFHDSDGKTFYSKTREEHERKKKEYLK